MHPDSVLQDCSLALKRNTFKINGINICEASSTRLEFNLLFEVVNKMVLRCPVAGKTTNLHETMERLKEENVTALGNLTFRKVFKS